MTNETKKRELEKPEVLAREYGVPKDSLRKAADEHGFTIRMGKAVRIARADMGELIKACREKPRERASISANRESGISATPDEMTSRPARATATKLKGLSSATSQLKAGQLAQFPQKQ